MFTPISTSKRGAVEITSLSLATIESAIRAGILPVRRFGNRTLIRIADLTAWIDSMPVGRPAAPPQLEGRRTGRPRKNAAEAAK